MNDCGTLLHAGQCQVILPANYLVELGFTISWKRRGCKIRHPKEGPLEVQVVKGCPLISREVGLRLLDRYEECVKKGKGVSKLDVNALPDGPREGAVRTWLRDQIRKGEGFWMTRLS